MRSLLLVSLLAAIGSGQAMAANPLASIQITDTLSGTTWTEKLGTSTVLGSADTGQAGLLTADASGNFTMTKGTYDGQQITGDNIDFWTWHQTGSYWSWNSKDMLGTDPMAAMELHGIAGKGDPELSYSLTVVNKKGRTQTYSLTADEMAIIPPLSGANTVFASITGTVNSGTLSIAQGQSFNLSADNGWTLTNAGVDLAATYSGSGSYNSLSPVKAGPQNGWNHMQLSTVFTVSGGIGSATVEGYASLTPIPEPESYAMLLAGLGMLGFMARRRQVL